MVYISPPYERGNFMVTFGIHLHLVMMAMAVILGVLLALTMRSIVLREKAMIRQRREDPQARASYESRWRNVAA
jgi:hypothetical protein